MESAAFKKAYAQLNPRQKEAVDAIEGPVMVVAGPGTGKTQVLALRIANIIARTDTPPEAVLALTFTDKATANMRSRLVDLIGQAGWRVKVRTFHSFCSEIIQSEPDVFPAVAGGLPLTDADRLGVLENLLETLDVPLLRPVGKPELYVSEISSALDTLKREGVTPEKFAKIAAAEKKKLGADADDSDIRRIGRHAQLARVYSAYQEFLTKEHRFDFADMLVHVDRALADDEGLLRSLQERFHYFLVDEHQDTNGLQNAIVNRLAAFHEKPNLFVVGDLQQAIYRFQGASLANFRDFELTWKGTRVIILTDNYRSTEAILRTAGAISPGQSDLAPRAGHDERPVVRYAFSSPAVQEFAVVEMVRERLNAGVSPEDIVVLARTNAELVPFADLLERNGVPSQMGGDDQVLADPSIQKIVVLARAVLGVGQSAPLLKALQVDLLGVDPLDAWTVADACERGKVNAWHIIKTDKAISSLTLVDAPALRRAAGVLTGLASAVRNLPATQALAEIVDASGILPVITDMPDGERTILRLHALYELVRDQLAADPSYRLGDFLSSLELLERHNSAVKSGIAVPQAAVQLLTVHKAKGLEFDTVFVPNATAQNWEAKRARAGLKLPAAVWKLTDEIDDALGDDAAEDARRIAYVAVTRAKQHAVFSWPMARADGKALEPSAFALAIPERYLQTGDAAPFEKKFAKAGHTRLLPSPGDTAPLRSRERVRELFAGRPLSVSAVNNFLECPWKYFYQNLLRFPGDTSPSAEYGKAAHAALEHLFRLWSSGERVSTAVLTNRFADIVRTAPLNAAMRAQIVREGTEDLAGWFEATKADWRKPLRCEEELTVTTATGLVLTGKLDKVEFLSGTPQGGPARVVVVDYKTKEPMSENAMRGRTRESTGNEFRQLVFYRLLLEHWRDGAWQMAEGRIDFLKPTSAGKYRSVSLSVSEREVADLRVLVEDMAEQIRNLSFWEKRCGERDCEFCAIRNSMKKR